MTGVVNGAPEEVFPPVASARTDNHRVIALRWGVYEPHHAFVEVLHPNKGLSTTLKTYIHARYVKCAAPRAYINIFP